MRSSVFVLMAAMLASPAFAEDASTSPTQGDGFFAGSADRLSWPYGSPPVYRVSDMATEVAPVSFETQLTSSCDCQRCIPCGFDTCCCDQRWAHRTGGFGELLYLRARDAEVAYAQIRDGATPFGRTGTVDPSYSTGFRVGFWSAWDCRSSLGVSYTGFDSSTNDELITDAPLSIASLVIHPSSVAAGSTGLEANASLDVSFDQIDITYRRIWGVTENASVNWLAGVRYGRIQQQFQSEISVNGTTTVQSELDFDGVGFTLGFDAERYAPCNGFLIYSKGNAAFLAGEFRGDYTQFDSTDPLEVQTNWQAGRIVPVLDLELGVGWQGCNNHLRVTTGYVVQSWFNTVSTDAWIQGVQNSNFVGLNNAMTFDGLTAKIEYVW
ncbi:Lpg1974 family pore-forming outer membrane protein [Blastopirellula retiformator]|uniref:Uncharacterized protein n=1 Tax=Blastopirellula retiformator TaxID=2527970 RepID=A0A5C5UVQ0_9BACT|nr:Lpg1974 family pore-forming outer membrane protein [Blastopirellula retiformator]TWT29919.1 hypothetical protein Enr8_45750 [Blastopirellula retiformator]